MSSELYSDTDDRHSVVSTLHLVAKQKNFVKIKIPDEIVKESVWGTRNQVALWLQNAEDATVVLRADIHHVAAIMCMHYGVSMSGITSHALARLWEEVRDEIKPEDLKRYDKRLRAFKACKARHIQEMGDSKYKMGRAYTSYRGKNTETQAEREQRIRAAEAAEQEQQDDEQQNSSIDNNEQQEE